MTGVHLLSNPTAAGDIEQVAHRILRSGRTVTRLDSRTLDSARAAVADAVVAGAERIVVVGGDGLVNLALQAVADTDTVMGIVPQGTGNDFARALGLPLDDVDAATDAALAGPTAVDAMSTTHGWVASVATFGFSGDVTDRANHLSWPRGQQRYTVATVLQLPRLRRIRASVEVDGAVHDATTTLLAVGNTAYFGGGMKVCPGTTPVDGRLEVVVIGPVSRTTFVRVFPRVFTGRHVSHRHVQVHSGAVVRLSADAPVDLWADGERMGPLPVECRCVPGAVKVAGVDGARLTPT